MEHSKAVKGKDTHHRFVQACTGRSHRALMEKGTRPSYRGRRDERLPFDQSPFQGEKTGG